MNVTEKESYSLKVVICITVENQFLFLLIFLFIMKNIKNYLKSLNFFRFCLTLKFVSLYSEELRAQYFFFTYCKMDKSITHEDILKAVTKSLNSRGNYIEDYVIAQEEHKDGSIHYHLYLKLTKKIRITMNDLFMFDLQIQEKTFKGDYQAVRSKQAVLR